MGGLAIVYAVVCVYIYVYFQVLAQLEDVLLIFTSMLEQRITGTSIKGSIHIHPYRGVKRSYSPGTKIIMSSDWLRPIELN